MLRIAPRPLGEYPWYVRLLLRAQRRKYGLVLTPALLWALGRLALAACGPWLVSADMRLAVDWLRAQPFSNGKVAAVGYCGGGRFAFLAAARCGVDGAAALYGLGISEHLAEIGNVRCPVQMHYGLKDQHIPRQEIDAVATGVQGRPSMEVFLYPEAGHSFANPVRPTYDAAATKLAGERIGRMLEAMRL